MRKKILSLALALLMLVSVFSIAAYAEDEGLTFETEISFLVANNFSISALSVGDIGGIGVEVKIHENDLAALDDATLEHSVEVTAIEAVDVRHDNARVNYETDRDAFRAIFDDVKVVDEEGNPVIDEETGEQKIDKFDGTTVFATVTIHFNSSRVFGQLNYSANLNGFAAPPDIPIPGVDLSAASIPTAIPAEGSVPGFPTVASSTLAQNDTRSTYTDIEKFDANGIVMDVTLSNGETGTVSYGKNADNMLTFVPSASKRLTVNTTEVAALFMGKPVFYVPISVSHSWTPAPVQISSKMGNDVAGYGYHATVCEGCGETHTAEACVPDDNWVFNEDATFTADGTETCHCAICGGECTRLKMGSAGYNTSFGNLHFLRVIFDYIAILLRGLKVVQFR